MTESKNTLGGSACKYIKKQKYCIRPCKKVHNENTKRKWYCKQTKRCSRKKRTRNITKKRNYTPESEPVPTEIPVIKETPVPTEIPVTSQNTNIRDMVSKTFSDFSKATNRFINPTQEKK
jgi:hypothetical protein